MKRKHIGPLAAGVLVASMLPSVPASAHGAPSHGGPGPFGRIATVPAYLNGDASDEAAAEIAAVSSDGRTVIYTDSPGERLGFIDITDSSRPKPAGVLELAGEPTSVAAFGRYALAAVNTRESFTDPSGQLLVVDVKSRKVVRTIELGGQPDSVAVAPSGRYVAIAIENERDEDVDDGAIPQLPAGWLSVVDTRTWSVSKVDLTGLAAVAPEDPEPEYVSINRDDEAVVSLQENNHLAVVRLRDGKVVKHFSAGAATVSKVDADDDGQIVLDDTVTAKREPDGVAWLDGNLFATANEGDYEGGSRGFSVFDKRTGRPVFDSGNALDRLAVQHGLYPDNRSDAKGVEPENVAVGTFGGTPYLFVNAERGNFVAVYDVRKPWAPRFVQLLPAVNGPEGVVTAPSRGLVVVSSEEDMPDEGIRASVQLYKFGAKSDFPSIVSTRDIGWGALSGLSAVPGKRDRLVSVTDSVYTPTRLLTIDTGDKPARIVGDLTVTKGGAPVGYDAEGVAARPGGGYWLGVEGTGPTGNPNLLVRLRPDGSVAEEVPFPADVAAAVTSNGIEGVAVTGHGSRSGEQVWVAIQRELTGDPKGLVRIGRYSVATKTWAWLAYPLDAAPAGAWVGLSELVAVDDDTFAVVERDNQRGPAAKVKKVYTFKVPKGFGTGLPVVKKRLAVDLLPLLRAGNGWTQDKVEGLAIGGDGRTYAVTDNDGVDESTGETVFLRLGKLL
ncbi:esterase-like activity of phytase family protein [Phytohabitans sp. ZYX-F-186]|uniref:Esterase-like activity of phytase family protein n=1 Tax=Phytohabitans maris TaxID=3071409 RepID=A0ABU0Z827_9ACTN|nr:esterase-like activity of phytase family protein [Phytohabitans sp. ZYX-F-186]MDQ7903221.1 esterase-like activity of phytase family protein [Phytohabitans sp. ZYX-F-186]